MFMRPLIGCQSTSLDASSAGCLKQWPANFNLLKPTFDDTGGKLPYLRYSKTDFLSGFDAFDSGF